MFGDAWSSVGKCPEALILCEYVWEVYVAVFGSVQIECKLF